MSEINHIALQETENVKGEILGKKIKSAIINAPKDGQGRWTQLRVASEIGLNKDHLSRVINGKAEISVEKLNAIAILFDVRFVVEIDGHESLINRNGSTEY